MSCTRIWTRGFASDPAGRPEVSPRHGALRRTLVALARFARRKPFGAGGALIILALLLMAAFAEWIAPYAYDQQIPGARLRPPGAGFLLGTDNVSRDIFSRIVYGARVTVTVSFSTVFLGRKRESPGTTSPATRMSVFTMSALA